MREGRPLWQTCCLGCLVAGLAALAGAVAVVWLFGGPGIERVASLPAGFPKEIPIFALPSCKSIDVLGGGQRSRILGVILAPIKLVGQFKPKRAETESGIVVSTAPLRIEWLGREPEPESWLDRTLRLAEEVDTVSLAWEDLPASRQAVLDHYRTAFAQAGMKTESSTDPATRTDYLVGAKDGLEVQVHLQEGSGGADIRNLAVIVSYRKR